MSESDIDPREIEGLRRKYVEMKRLREARASGDLGDPMPALRALAREFPGALREIDELSIERIEARIEALSRALDLGTVERWMVALERYHRWMRLALGLRRGAPERTIERAREWLARSGEPLASKLDDEHLARLLRPPMGRLNRAVFDLVGAELGIDPRLVEALLVERRM